MSVKKKSKRHSLREKIKLLIKEHDTRVELDEGFPEDHHESLSIFIDGVRALINK